MAKSLDHKASIQLIASTVVPGMGSGAMYPKDNLQPKPEDSSSMGKQKKKAAKNSRSKFFRNKSSRNAPDYDIKIHRSEYGPPNKPISEEVISRDSKNFNHNPGVPESSTRSQDSTLSQTLEHAGDWTAVDTISAPDPQTPTGTSKVKKQLTFQDDEPPEVVHGEHFLNDSENWGDNSIHPPAGKYLKEPRRSRTGKELWETMRVKMLESDNSPGGKASNSDKTFVEITSPEGFFEMTPSKELSPSAKWHALVHQLLALKRSGQIPNGVLSLRTSFSSRPSLVALGSRANNLTKIPVLVQTYSTGHSADDETDDDLGRKNSAVIIASPGEATVFTRNYDFCKVSVLLCELLLLIGLLVIVFSFSMKTSPTIKPWETPYWAGVPLIIAGSLGVSLRCRSWQDVCSDISLKTLEVLFNLIVITALVVCSIALIFSLDFFQTLLSLNEPTFLPLAENATPVTPPSDSFVMSYCNFNQSNLFTSSYQESSKHQSFLVAHIQTSTDCSDFLFNIMNYSFMLCAILSIAVVVSITIIIKSVYRFYRSFLMRHKLSGKKLDHDDDDDDDDDDDFDQD